MKATLINKSDFGSLDTLYTFKLAEPVNAKAGQFAEIKVHNGLAPYLRRPISIFHIDGDVLELLVRTVGAGTKLMLDWEPGHETDLLIPLGNSYEWQEGSGERLLVGGGCGIAPLNYLAEKLLDAGKNVHLLYLPKRDDAILGAVHRLAEMEVSYAENRHGLPLALKAALDAGKGASGVYACGPDAMLRTVVEICTERNTKCQVSLEERMGCGFGICVGCAVPIKSGDGFVYKKACVDGPVFNGEEVIFHE